MLTYRLSRFSPGSRLVLLLGILAVAFLAGSATAQTNSIDLKPKPAPRKPSILFILADDLGYGDLGCYGQTQIRTPNIDALASEGLRFTSFYAGSPASAPSRATLLTGKNTGHARIRGEGTVPLEPDDLTLTELLKQSGYHTGALGVWGLGGPGSSGVPSKKGFDQWFGFLEESQADEHFPQFLNRTGEGYERNVQIKDNLEGKRDKYSDDYFTEAALNFLDSAKPERFNNYRAFFLYLPYTIPRANDDLAHRTGNGMEVPNDAPYSDEPWPQPEKNRAAMITRLDGYVGQLMKKLKDMKMDNNTIVIFTSVNGPAKEGGVDPKYFKSTGPFRGAKRELYEGGIRVPFIVRWPLGGFKPGTTTDVPSALWDILPTAAELTQTPAPKGLDGISLAPTLRGQRQRDRHEPLYWESRDNGFQQAVRDGEWKALRTGLDGALELYNLKTDPAETTNVADKNPDVIAKLETYLKTARTPDPNWPPQAPSDHANK